MAAHPTARRVAPVVIALGLVVAGCGSFAGPAADHPTATASGPAGVEASKTAAGNASAVRQPAGQPVDLSADLAALDAGLQQIDGALQAASDSIDQSAPDSEDQ